jgi:hypothetical protein
MQILSQQLVNLIAQPVTLDDSTGGAHGSLQ